MLLAAPAWSFVCVRRWQLQVLACLPHGVWGPLLGPHLVTGWAAWGAVPSLCLRSPCFCAASPCRLLALEPPPEPVARASGQPPCPRRSPHQSRPCAGLSAPGGPWDGGLREPIPGASWDLTVALVPVLTALLGLLTHVGLGGSSVHLAGPVGTGG